MELIGWLVVGVLVVVAVTSVAHRVGVAPPLVLLVIGAGVGMLSVVPPIVVGPELILAVILPPLLYSGAVSLPAMDFRRDLTTISALSVGLVIVSAVIVGLVISALLPGLGLAGGIALGAVVSPTDAVATRIVRRHRVSPRVVAILEGESLLNDASALVLLRTAVAAMAATGLSAGRVAGDFVWAVVSAIVVGWIVGKATLWLRSHLSFAPAGVAVSLVVPYVAYLPTEHLRGSGLVAAVVAGLVTGTGAPRRLRAEDRMTELAVWRTLELLLESGVFLLMGLELFGLLENLRGSRGDLPTALLLGLLTCGLILAVRAAFVAPSLLLLRRRTARISERREQLAEFQERLDTWDQELPAAGRRAHRLRRIARVRQIAGGRGTRGPEHAEGRIQRLTSMVRRRIADIDYLAAENFGWREGTLLVCAGMRGAVTLAAAQSLPAATVHRSTLVVVAFVVAAGTLLVQGGTLPALIRLLGLRRDEDPDERTDLEAVQAELARAAAERVADPSLRRPDGQPYASTTLKRVRRVTDVVLRHVEPTDGEARAAALAERAEEEMLRLDLIDTQRAALLRLRTEGVYGSQALAEELRILDAEQMELELRAVAPPEQD
ncbi:MAG: sodium:proton antiporter [Micrococcales bacterium]|nr:sodium:proton antiporter [Micrococcales bacterium]